MEDTGVSDPQSLDKNYWIQRVGEVSRDQCLLTFSAWYSLGVF